MDSVQMEYSRAGFSKQIYTEIESRSHESIVCFVAFALPVIGGVAKILESAYRFYQGSDGLEKIAIKQAGFSNKEFTVIEYQDALLHEVRRRQGRDAIFLAARITSLIVFSITTAFSPAGAMIIGIYASWSLGMMILEQSAYSKALKAPSIRQAQVD